MNLDGIGVMVADPTGKIYEANQYLLQLLGYSREELQDGLMRWDELIPPENLEDSRQGVQTILEAGMAGPWEKEYIHKNGNRISALVGGATIDPEKELILGFVLDISRQKAQERQQATLFRLLSHELRNPLTNIQCFVELADHQIQYLLDKNLSDQSISSLTEVSSYLRKTLHQVSSQQNIIYHLLDKTQQSTERVEISFSRHDLVEIVYAIVEEQQRLHPDRIIRIETPAKEYLPVMVDRNRVEYLIRNYLSNALVQSSMGQTVVVGFHLNEQEAKVWVQILGSAHTLEEI